MEFPGESQTTEGKPSEKRDARYLMKSLQMIPTNPEIIGALESKAA